MKKKAFKKMLAVAASAAMVLSLGACGSGDSGSENESGGGTAGADGCDHRPDQAGRGLH